MQSIYHAYQSYERRIARGEMDRRGVVPRPCAASEPLPARLGEILIRAGLRLKRARRAGHAMPVTTMAGK